MSHNKEKYLTTALNFANVSLRQFENKPIMTFRILLSGTLRVLITGGFTISNMFVRCAEGVESLFMN